MKRTILWSFVIAAAFLLVNAAVSSPHVFSPDGEKFDLSTLADGETKVFGEGDHQVTATRMGDTVTMKLAQGTEKARTFTCTIGKDSCYIMTMGDDGASKIAVMKARSEGDGDLLSATEDVFVMATGEGEGEHSFTWVCDENGDPDCNHFATTFIELDSLDGLHEYGKASVSVGAGGPHASFIQLDGMDGKVTLRCPEGDTTMTLKKEVKESSGPYFCPQHNVQLEEVKGKKISIKEILVGKPHQEEEE